MWDIFKKPQSQGYTHSEDWSDTQHYSHTYEDWKKARTSQAITATNDKILTKEALEKMVEMMASMGQERDPYDVAEKAMNIELEKKGLPGMDKIMEVFEKSCPEYFI